MPPPDPNPIGSITAFTAAYPGVDAFDTLLCSAPSAWLNAFSAVETLCSELKELDIDYLKALATMDWLIAAAET
jgi:hypothetical protein